jgi:hypothetical protein
MRLLSLSFLLLAAFQCGAQTTLRLYYERSLYCQAGDSLYLVKELGEGCYFQGYDMIDSTRVFVAYMPWCEGSEPTTVLTIVDLRTKTETVKGNLAGTGDSWFQYSAENGLLVGNWGKGIYTWSLARMEQTEPELVVPSEGCLLPFWLDSRTVGYVPCGFPIRQVQYYRLDKH